MTGSLSIAVETLASPSLSGPTPEGASRMRGLLGLARSIGFRAATLSATVPGLRPRELDRSARRELAAMMRQADLAFTGLDLWIPPEHFANPAHVDRAAAAAGAACGMADELLRLSRLVGGSGASGGGSRPVVCVSLPEGIESSVLAAIRDAALRTGAVVANVTWPLESAIGREAGDPVMLGIDPAAAILAGQDPVAAVAKWGGRLGAARLSDASRRTAARAVPGTPGGELDITAYKVSLGAVSGGVPVIADLSGTPRPAEGPAEALRAWNAAAVIGAP